MQFAAFFDIELGDGVVESTSQLPDVLEESAVG